MTFPVDRKSTLEVSLLFKSSRTHFGRLSSKASRTVIRRSFAKSSSFGKTLYGRLPVWHKNYAYSSIK